MGVGIGARRHAFMAQRVLADRGVRPRWTSIWNTAGANELSVE